jgi:hypothetical protein
MASVRIRATGVEAASDRLKKVGHKSLEQRATLKKVADSTARRISGVPVDTGRLKASVDVASVSPLGFTIASDVPYAGYVFNGTKYMRARPPHIPSNVADLTASAVGSDIVR